MRGRSAPPPRVTFPSRGKSPKARQGLCPLESPGAWSPPFSRSLRYAPSRAGLPSTTNLDRFATLSWWVNRSFFSPSYTGGHTPCCQSVARQGCPRGCRRFYTPATNTAMAEGGGIQGGPPPCAGGPGTRRFLAYLCLLSLREKVGRGAGRSARSLRVWELCSHIGECRGGPQAAPRIGVAGAYFPCASIRSARSLR